MGIKLNFIVINNELNHSFAFISLGCSIFLFFKVRAINKKHASFKFNSSFFYFVCFIQLSLTASGEFADDPHDRLSICGDFNVKVIFDLVIFLANLFVR